MKLDSTEEKYWWVYVNHQTADGKTHLSDDEGNILCGNAGNASCMGGKVGMLELIEHYNANTIGLLIAPECKRCQKIAFKIATKQLN